MADKLVPSLDDGGAIRRFRDMGDGTFAEVVSMSAGTAGAAGFPAGATPVAAVVTAANALTAPALPAAVGKTTYVTGIQFSAASPTAATIIGANLQGVLGGTVQYVLPLPASSAQAALTPFALTFEPPLPASAANTAITLSVSAVGAGSITQTAAIQGFQL